MVKRKRSSAGTGRGTSGPRGTSRPDTSPTSTLSRLWERFRIRALALSATLALVGGLTFDPKLYINGDNVDYILLAQRILNEGILWGSEKFPPFFPLLLAPVQMFWGTAWVPQKILVSLLFAASGPLVLWLAERVLPRRFALPAAALGMLSVPVLEFSHYVMSEVPYLFFQAAGLVVGERLLRRHGRIDLPWRPLALFFALCACAFYTRTIGAVLPGAFLLACLFQRRFRMFLAGGALAALLLLPWIVHTSLAEAEGTTYLTQLLRVNPYYPEEGILTPATFLQRVALNAERYFSVEIPRILVPIGFDTTYLPRPEVHRPWPAYLWGLPCALMLAGLWKSRRRLPLGVGCVVLTLLVCFLWPPIWTSVRFIIPILPLLMLFFLAGFHDLQRAAGGMPRWESGSGEGPPTARGNDRSGGARPRGGPARGLPEIATAALLIALSATSLRNAALYGRETREYPPPWSFYFRTAEWAGQNLPPESLIVDRKPAMFSLVSGLRAVGFPREADPDRMIEHFRQAGADFVHVSSIPYDDIVRFLIPTLQQRPTYFEPYWRTEMERSMMSALFRFDPAGEQGALAPSVGAERAGRAEGAGRRP
ncbi:MAG: hypothetical protein V1774_05170 [Candidatus Eisenbacteria bacterium]